MYKKNLDIWINTIKVRKELSMKIKKISLFIATVLGVSLLAGCGADSSLNSNSNSSSVVKNDNSKQDSNN